MDGTAANLGYRKKSWEGSEKITFLGYQKYEEKGDCTIHPLFNWGVSEKNPEVWEGSEKMACLGYRKYDKKVGWVHPWAIRGPDVKEKGGWMALLWIWGIGKNPERGVGKNYLFGVLEIEGKIRVIWSIPFSVEGYRKKMTCLGYQKYEEKWGLDHQSPFQWRSIRKEQDLLLKKTCFGSGGGKDWERRGKGKICWRRTIPAQHGNTFGWSLS